MSIVVYAETFSYCPNIQRASVLQVALQRTLGVATIALPFERRVHALLPFKTVFIAASIP